MNRRDTTGTRAESGALCAFALGCYLAAFACVLMLGYALAGMAADGVGRQAVRAAVREMF